LFLILASTCLQAATTIDPVNKDAYGGNVGWMDWSGGTGEIATGVVIGAYVCSGYIYSANVGWINLGGGSPNVNPNADPTGKGMTIEQDYLAGTNPNEAASILEITGQSFSSDGAGATLSWNSVPARHYYIQETLSLSPANWITNRVGLISPDGSSTTSSITDPRAAQRFYRIQAVQPLTP
jgi:hypothetical protein